jgi:putative inorganic carbon (hco3(-)) transporter
VRARQIIWRPVHAVIAATAVYAALSALAAGTLFQEDGLFAILDRLGLVPFALFTLAPLVFGSRRQRDVLLVTLLVVGTYLGFVAVCQGLDLDWLVWPSYITDPGVGLHPTRARGPFVEAVANGLGLYGCAVAGAVAAYTWVGRRARWWGFAVCVLCLAGTIFTLTRSIWIGSLIGTVVALLMSRQTRRVLVPMLTLAALVALAALTLVPGFGDQAGERSSAQRPIWDRYNTNLAGIRAVEDEPIFGIGWQRWQDESSEYLRLSEDYPLTGTTIEIHNVFLSHAAELGLLGAGLWLVAFASAIGAAVLRPGPAELDPWRLGMIAITIQWLVVAAFGPLSYAFPNVLLWTWAGICCLGHLSRPLEVDA